MPARNETSYFSGTECWIYLKPSCKIKFVCCLEIYFKRYQFGPCWDLGGPFFTKVPQKSALQGPFRSHLGANEGPSGFPEPW